MLSLHIRVQLCNWTDNTTKKNGNTFQDSEKSLARRLAHTLVVPSDQLSVSIESSTQFSSYHQQQPTVLVDIDMHGSTISSGQVAEVAAIVAVGMTCSMDRVFVSVA